MFTSLSPQRCHHQPQHPCQDNMRKFMVTVSSQLFIQKVLTVLNTHILHHDDKPRLFTFLPISFNLNYSRLSNKRVDPLIFPVNENSRQPFYWITTLLLKNHENHDENVIFYRSFTLVNIDVLCKKRKRKKNCAPNPFIPYNPFIAHFTSWPPTLLLRSPLLFDSREYFPEPYILCYIHPFPQPSSSMTDMLCV